MCNLYSYTRSQEEACRLMRVLYDHTGNQPPLPAVFPDQVAPVVRGRKDGAREMLAMRWGLPPPQSGLRPVSNIRNLASPWWQPWRGTQWRCLVPATSFCEWSDARPKVPHWFALGSQRPLFAFAGIWRTWTGERGKEAGEHLLFGFLTTEPNALVRPVHAKAMPVMLTDPAEWDAWLNAPIDEALCLLRPLAPERLSIVASGEREDGAAASKAESAPLLPLFEPRL